MAIVEVDVSKRANTLLIGVQGEIDAQVFNFDISSWIEEYGSGGSASIDLQRPGESTSYTKPLTLTDGVAEWIVDNVDNAVAGQGLAQLVYVTPGEDKKTKTATYVTIIERALDEQRGETPDPYASYIDEVRAINSVVSAALLETLAARTTAVSAAGNAASDAQAAEAAAESASADAESAGQSAESAEISARAAAAIVEVATNGETITDSDGTVYVVGHTVNAAGFEVETYTPVS